MVRRTGRIPAGAMGKGFDEAIATVCVLSVWRRRAPVHRERVCADGSGADSGDDRAKVSIAIGGESSRGAAGIDHAAAAPWNSRDSGGAGKRVTAAKRSRKIFHRRTVGRGGLGFSSPQKAG